MTIRFWCVGVSSAFIAVTPPAWALQQERRVEPASHVGAATAEEGPIDQVRLVRELMRRRGGDPAAAAQLVQMCREFEPAVAAELFEELAAAHLAAGKVDLAADARLLLLQTHPEAPSAQKAALWLTRLYASSEVAHMHRTQGGDEPEGADQGLALYAYSMAGEFESAAKLRAEAAGLEQPVEDPALRFARAVAARRAGLEKPASSQLTPLKHTRAGDAWGDCARVEAWLAGARDGATPPKPLAQCVRAEARPKLDGVLDEACWQGDGSLLGGTAQADVTRTVRLAHDDEFLYVAAAFSPAPGVDYAADDRPRTHDADLSQRDRVTLALDMDRDYATAWELTIDSRGWTGDRCWGDAAWNPEWFVAAGPPAESGGGLTLDRVWIVEAAIPWTALARQAPKAGEAWAASIERTVPGGTSEHWPPGGVSGQAPVGPAAFGVLRFE